jgi:hypothetical protein
LSVEIDDPSRAAPFVFLIVGKQLEELASPLSGVRSTPALTETDRPI